MRNVMVNNFGKFELLTAAPSGRRYETFDDYAKDVLFWNFFVDSIRIVRGINATFRLTGNTVECNPGALWTTFDAVAESVGVVVDDNMRAFLDLPLRTRLVITDDLRVPARKLAGVLLVYGGRGKTAEWAAHVRQVGDIVIEATEIEIQQ